MAVIALDTFWRPVVDFALPPRCPGCGAIIPAQGNFCAACWSQLTFTGPPWCAGCGIPFSVDRGDGARCGACLATPPAHDGVRAAVHYNALSRDVALKLKYGRRLWLASLMARAMLRHLPAPEQGVARLVPVPLHWTRLWQRGFNQSALLAQAIARQRSDAFCFDPDMLHRTRRTPSLRAMNPRQRSNAVRGAFRVADRALPRIAGARILLVDDVFTTGATAHACVRALKAAGAASVEVHVWARVIGAQDA